MWTLAFVALACGSRGDQRPNLILISLDTVRADHLSLYGYERATSPELDSLATESVVFERAYTTASWTQPAHMSLFTGLWPMQHGVMGPRAALAPSVPTLAERLRAEGYFTVALYSPGWIDERHGFDRGFDRFWPHADGAECDEQLRALEAELPADKPLFLFLHLFDAHNQKLTVPGNLPYDSPDPFATLFLADARERLAGSDPKRMWTGEAPPTEAELEAIVALYDGGLAYVDHLVGSWVARWRESGLLGRSLLVVSSDHGEPLAQREGKLNGHGKMWEEGLRVPLLVRLPTGERAGERLGHTVSLVDIVPTVLEELGLGAGAELPGSSLFGQPGDSARLIAQHPQWAVATRGPLKYVQPSMGREEGRGRMYDLALDPAEERPLERGDPQIEALRSELESVLILRGPHFTRRGQVQRARAMSAQEAAELKALGYGGD